MTTFTFPFLRPVMMTFTLAPVKCSFCGLVLRFLLTKLSNFNCRMRPHESFLLPLKGTLHVDPRGRKGFDSMYEAICCRHYWDKLNSPQPPSLPSHQPGKLQQNMKAQKALVAWPLVCYLKDFDLWCNSIESTSVLEFGPVRFVQKT